MSAPRLDPKLIGRPALGEFPKPDTGLDFGPAAPEAGTALDRRPAHPLALPRGPLHARLDALGEDCSLQLGVGGGDVEEGLTEG